MTVTGVRWQTEKSHKKSIKVLDVTFSGALEESAVDDVAAYSLDAATKSKKLGTRFTKPVPFSRATYSPSLKTVTLMPRGKVPKGDTQLTINASSVLDAESRELDGNDDGQPGGNYVATLNNQDVITAAISAASARSMSEKATDAALLDGHFDVKTSPRWGHSQARR